MTALHPLYRLYVIGFPLAMVAHAYELVTIPPVGQWPLFGGWLILMALGLRHSAAAVRRRKVEGSVSQHE